MNKNAEISERIAKLIEYTGISSNEFAKKLGYKRSQTIYDILNGKSAPSYDFFNRFFSTEYSDKISSKWLMTGEGSMINETSEGHLQQVAEPTSNYGSKEKDKPWIVMLESKDKELSKCHQEIGRLKEVVRRLQTNHPNPEDVSESK